MQDNIKDVLNHLCVHLPVKLQAECTDFVHTYTSELVDMLITDFKPQEICVSLKLCPEPNMSNSLENLYDDLIMFNEENDSDLDACE